jgi:pimeloyl-ACP methyl ester carboxylesterase
VSEERYHQAARELAQAAASASGLFADVTTGRPLLLGHSIGGAAAVLALVQRPAAAGAVDLDGDFAPGLAAPAPARPILYVTGSEADDPDRTRRRRAADWARLAANNPFARRLPIPEMRHHDVTDAASLPEALVTEARAAGRLGPLGGAQIRRRLVPMILALQAGANPPVTGS